MSGSSKLSNGPGLAVWDDLSRGGRRLSTTMNETMREVTTGETLRAPWQMKHRKCGDVRMIEEGKR